MTLNSLVDRLEEIFASKYLAWALCGLFVTAGVILAFVANGTCDEGDSVMHYQFARWAPKHPKLFFDHWAKPLFVLLAMPAAQLGMHGMKIFNLLLSAITILNAYNIAAHLKIERKALTVFILILTPSLIIHSLSGLTEPMFALVLSTGVLLYFKDRRILATLVISFLPFVRSEGLIICGVFALMLLLEKKWLLLPLLAVGHVVYGIVGMYYHHTPMWVFTHIPYARLSSFYGKGTWRHFFVHLPVITGVPLIILLVTGMIYGFVKLVTAFKANMREQVLIYGCFTAYFVGHVCFWGLGIFNSLGLMRVLIGILPVMAIIELRGLNMLVQIIPNITFSRVVMFALLAYIVVFPFTHNVYAWNYKRDFCLNARQQSQDDLGNYIKAHYPYYKTSRYYYDANYVAVIMDIDYFDTTVSRRIWEDYTVFPTEKDFAIWDDYYSNVEFNTPLTHLTSDGRFEELMTATHYDFWNYPKTSVLFKGTGK